MSTEAQKRADKNYRDRLKKKGVKQHNFFATDKEFVIVKAVLQALRMIEPCEVEKIENLDVSDDFLTFTLIKEK